jgi:hypothetical protein
MGQDDLIRASEISQYAFCARAWWLARVKGYPSANVAAMREGTARHRAHGRGVVTAYRLRRLAVALLLLAGAILAAALVMWIIAGLGN